MSFWNFRVVPGSFSSTSSLGHCVHSHTQTLSLPHPSPSQTTPPAPHAPHAPLAPHAPHFPVFWFRSGVFKHTTSGKEINIYKAGFKTVNKVNKNQFLSQAEVANKEGYVVKFIKGRPLRVKYKFEKHKGKRNRKYFVQIHFHLNLNCYTMFILWCFATRFYHSKRFCGAEISSVKFLVERGLLCREEGRIPIFCFWEF